MYTKPIQENNYFNNKPWTQNLKLKKENVNYFLGKILLAILVTLKFELK